MCVKFSHENLNFGPYLSHPTNTYTCGVVIVPKMCGGYWLPITIYSLRFVKKYYKFNTLKKKKKPEGEEN